MVFSFKQCDSGIVGDKRGEHATEGGRVGPLVGVVTKDNAVHETGVYAYEADREAKVQDSLVEEDHAIITGRSIDGGGGRIWSSWGGG